VFSSGAAKILDPQDGRVSMVNGQCLKPIVTNDVALSLIESINLVDPLFFWSVILHLVFGFCGW